MKLVVLCVSVACLLGLVSAPAGAAARPCGKSFIDVDNNGVCSAGDVSLDTYLKPLGSTAGNFTVVNVDTNQPIAGPSGPIYTPPADGHPVGVVLGGSISVGTEIEFSVFATGNLHFDGRLSLNLDSDLVATSCRMIDFGKGSRTTVNAADDTFAEFHARADQCADTTAPATLEVSKGAWVSTENFLRLEGDNVQLDDHAQLSTFGNINLTDPNLELHAGNMTLGKGVQIAGASGEIDINNCGANVTADHLLVKVSFLDWGDNDVVGLCDHSFSNGEFYNETGSPQRLTLTNSRIDMGLNGTAGFFMKPGVDANNMQFYPCDAITLIKTKVTPPGGDFETIPTPRINPTGPCTGTITG